MNIEEMQSNYTGSKPRIHHKTIGKGPPLIFLHGIGGNSSNWEEQQIFFSKVQEHILVVHKFHIRAPL